MICFILYHYFQFISIVKHRCYALSSNVQIKLRQAIRVLCVNGPLTVHICPAAAAAAMMSQSQSLFCFCFKPTQSKRAHMSLLVARMCYVVVTHVCSSMCNYVGECVFSHHHYDVGLPGKTISKIHMKTQKF